MSGHFLSLSDLGSGTAIRSIIARASELKKITASRHRKSLLGMTGILLFEKPSTRTRVAFEAGLQQLGANTIYLSADTTQLSRSEPPEDTARVLSRMADIIIIRAARHELLARMAVVSSVPLINALTDRGHPCQLLADMQTYFEHRGDIRNRKVVLLGDCNNNIAHSYIEASELLDFSLFLACPDEAVPEQAENSARVTVVNDPQDAAKDADLLVTDVWTSMGQEQERERREQLFKNYQLNDKLLSLAAPDALYMHCLPAYRDQEISTELLERKDTVIWEEAENRLHSQKALLEYLLC